MKCLFCREISDTSRSREHVVPESLGNETIVLPPGIVCDGCNNYLSREVEKPFLDSEPIRSLRFRQDIFSKKNRISPVTGILDFRFPVQMHREIEDGQLSASISTDDEGTRRLLNSKKGSLIFAVHDMPPANDIAARFVAKVALEYLAYRQFENTPAQMSQLVEERQLDPIRNFVRRGHPKHWPISLRRIYPEDTVFEEGPDGRYQNLHEYDILVTDHNEWYFVLAIFGVEYVINNGGPELEGYEAWLADHKNISPLYFGKNES